MRPALYARRTTPDGVFGCKLHWEHALWLRAEMLGDTDGARLTGLDFDASVFEAIFPGATYIRILRLDVDRQAVSFTIAAQTGRWGDIPGQDMGGGPAEPVYRFADVDRCRRWLEASELAWDRFFRANRISSLEVVYEDFVDDYAGTVARIAERLGITGGLEIPRPRMRSQRTGRNDDHLERYLADRALHGLDGPPHLKGGVVPRAQV